MKTSNKLLMAIGLIIIACLVGYNFALKKEYDKGEFRSPYYGMQKLNLGTFNTIENIAANRLGVTIRQGSTYQVYVNPDIGKKISFANRNGVLRINYISDNNDDRYLYSDGAIIVCPVIDDVTTSANMDNKTNENNPIFEPNISTNIFGFTQPAMNIRVGNFTRVETDKNNLGELRTVVGDSSSFYAQLHIGNDDKIDHADFNIPGSSLLQLYSSHIGTSTNHISNSASIYVCNGNLKLFINQQNKTQ